MSIVVAMTPLDDLIVFCTCCKTGLSNKVDFDTICDDWGKDRAWAYKIIEAILRDELAKGGCQHAQDGAENLPIIRRKDGKPGWMEA